MSIPWTCILLFLASAKSNDITNSFVKSILVQKYPWYYLVPWTFWNKEQRVASHITVKNRQLSTESVNFDWSRAWQWTINSNTVAFGSESVILNEILNPIATCICVYMSRDMSFPTMWYVRLAKPQISLRICAVWSEPLLFAWMIYGY